MDNIEYRGYEIEIRQDEYCDSPDEWGDEERFLIFNHRDFCVKRDGFDGQEIFNKYYEQGKKLYDGYWMFIVHAYIHSGVALSLSRDGYPFNDRWDVSTAGFVFIKRVKDSWTQDKAYEHAEQLIKTWNQYLSGDVWGYRSEAGSCFGFYGKDGREQMLEEAKDEIDWLIKDKIKDHNQYLKTMIKNKVPLGKRKELVI